MFNIGPLELMVILIVALLVVGPKRLPEVGRSIGRGLREFRRAQEEVQRTLQLTLDEPPPSPAAPAPAAPEGSAPAEDGQQAEAAPGDASTTPGAAEVAATLGQGIAELRRVREELRRSFRVDLDEDSAPRPSRPVAEAAEPPPSPTPDPE